MLTWNQHKNKSISSKRIMMLRLKDSLGLESCGYNTSLLLIFCSVTLIFRDSLQAPSSVVKNAIPQYW